jgi:long-chain acyl-CoA synthetase
MATSNETILSRLADWAKQAPTSAALYHRQDNEWKAISAKQYWESVTAIAFFLGQKGFGSEDIITILSYNCPAWPMSELGAILAGGCSAGIYPNVVAKDVQYVLNHTQSRFFAVQNEDYFNKLGEFRESILAQVKVILVFEGSTHFSDKAISFHDAVAQGRALMTEKKVVDYLQAVDPQRPAFLIYTSGTTGTPKGAMISNHNFIFTIDQVRKHWDLPVAGSLFSFLPLCHIAEKLQSIAAGISCRYATYYCSAFEFVSEELPQVQPSLLLAVPRVWEKMVEGVQLKISQMHPVQKNLVTLAFAHAEHLLHYQMQGKPLSPFMLARKFVFDKLIFSKIRHQLGLAKIEVAACGAGALSQQVWHFFQTIGVEIQEDFGQTESTGVICMTKRGTFSMGLTGIPVGQIEVSIAADGEIRTRGPHVFLGYYKDPTRDFLDDNHWLKTGDIGEWTADGQLKIIGRKREILKTSGGKMIAPVPIEEKIKMSPLISQACMVGDQKKFPAVLIVPSEKFFDEMKRENVSYETDRNGVIVNPILRARIKTEIDRINQELSHYEQVKDFVLLSNEFTIARGELTPTLKLKRFVIEQHYDKVISEIYAA